MEGVQPCRLQERGVRGVLQGDPNSFLSIYMHWLLTQEQNIMTPEEWPEFMSSLKQELPLTFRVTGSRAHAETINDIIKDTYVPNMQNVEDRKSVV